ncbi:hypothetical protein DEHRE_04660 [Dehalobacter restrictus DSM 9455]|uniref:Uncharacterized protein n=1 Tax=Dehalobacter restrictus (strain DSM 9455 / PER-K23) TaxID=871738 RepID=A0ABM5P929_DEHRP|nr:hypothetical protein DEHRE_04660 [Dehalobacter restrictus DSM 9455]
MGKYPVLSLWKRLGHIGNAQKPRDERYKKSKPEKE